MDKDGSLLQGNNLKKNIIWNLFGASSNALTSLFFLIIVTRINGLGDSGIFTLAFSLACLFCIFGGYQGRVFQVTDVKKEFNDKEYIAHRAITFSMMMILAYLYTVFMGYSSYKMIITLLLCLVKGLEVLADVFYGIMQKNDTLYKCGFSLTIKSMMSVFVFLMIDLVTNNLMWACISLVFVWLILLVGYDIPQTKRYLDKKDQVNFRNVGKLFKSGFFAFAVLFLSVYLVNVPKYALDGKVSSDLIAIFGIILMPATLISLCAQYVLQPFLPKISLYYAEQKWQQFKKLIFMILFFIIAVGILAMICGYLIGLPVLGYVYNVDLGDYMMPFMIIIAGAIFYSMCMVLSAVLTTIRRTMQQFVIYAVVSLFGYFISLYFVQYYKLNGAANAYFLIMTLQFILYYIYYYVAIKSLEKREVSICH